MLDLPILVEFLESLEPDLPALRAMGLHLWATGPEAHLAGINNLLSEAAAQVDEPVPGYLSAPQSIMDTCLYIFTSGTTGEIPRQRLGRSRERTLRSIWPPSQAVSLLPLPKLPTLPGHGTPHLTVPLLPPFRPAQGCSHQSPEGPAVPGVLPAVWSSPGRCDLPRAPTVPHVWLPAGHRGLLGHWSVSLTYSSSTEVPNLPNAVPFNTLIQFCMLW